MKKGKEEIIEIEEDVRIPGTDILLEKGDRIEVLQETVTSEISSAVSNAVKFRPASIDAEKIAHEIALGVHDGIQSMPISQSDQSEIYQEVIDYLRSTSV